MNQSLLFGHNKLAAVRQWDGERQRLSDEAPVVARARTAVVFWHRIIPALLAFVPELPGLQLANIVTQWSADSHVVALLC